jgi:squalene-hopene/tetraprenyl-beta-curcumene cyclase
VVSGGLVQFGRLRATYEKARNELLAERTPDGHWVGELSSSALATATAVSALAVVRRRVQAGSPARVLAGFRVQETVESRKSKVESPSDLTFDLRPSTFDAGLLNELILRGVAWLVKQQNADGGFGDTDLSHSNIATTMLVVAALHLAGATVEQAELVSRANGYIDAKGRLQGLRERYGIDKTFAVPIMMGWSSGARWIRCRLSWRACRRRGIGSSACRS